MIQEDNLYIKGLPGYITNDLLKQVFSQYCTVTSCKVLPPLEGKEDAAGFVRCATKEQAAWVKENLNGQIPNGLSTPVVVRLAGERPPPAAKGKGGGGGGGGKGGKGGSKGGNKQDMPPSVSVYVKGLPTTCTEDQLRTIFGQYCVVISSKVLPVPEGKNLAAGFVRLSEDDAKWCMENLQGETPGGLETPINLSYADAGGKDGQKGKGKESTTQMTAEVQESDNLYVKGFPAGITEDQLKQVFGQFGAVTSVKIMIAPDQEDKGGKKGKGKKPKLCAVLVRMGSKDEAKKVIELLDGQCPPGCSVALTVRYVGDGQPVVQKAVKKLEAGDTLYVGVIDSFDVDKKCGWMTCEDLWGAKQPGEMYVHENVLNQAKAGPGDTVCNFVYWKGDSPSASSPMIRLAAECTEENKQYALKGWYKGVIDVEKGFGFVQQGDLSALFGKDTYVTKDIGGTVRPGWVSFNVKCYRDKNTGKYQATATGMAACEEDWKPTPGDLSVSRQVEKKGKGKGAAGGWGCGAQAGKGAAAGGWGAAAASGKGATGQGGSGGWGSDYGGDWWGGDYDWGSDYMSNAMSMMMGLMKQWSKGGSGSGSGSGGWGAQKRKWDANDGGSSWKVSKPSDGSPAGQGVVVAPPGRNAPPSADSAPAPALTETAAATSDTP